MCPRTAFLCRSTTPAKIVGFQGGAVSPLGGAIPEVLMQASVPLVSRPFTSLQQRKYIARTMRGHRADLQPTVSLGAILFWTESC